MVMNPRYQKLAQAELDRAIRPGHLPTFEDRHSLPFLTSILMEAARWNPVAPFGEQSKLITSAVFFTSLTTQLAVPRFLESEDVYRGFRLPKNSIIIPNILGILHDEVGFLPFESLDAALTTPSENISRSKDL